MQKTHQVLGLETTISYIFYFLQCLNSCHSVYFLSPGSERLPRSHARPFFLGNIKHRIGNDIIIQPSSPSPIFIKISAANIIAVMAACLGGLVASSCATQAINNYIDIIINVAVTNNQQPMASHKYDIRRQKTDIINFEAPKNG